MARVTVEDCVLRIPNRFDLVALAAQRARLISGGEPLTVERDRDKNPVVALREIAEGTIELDALRESVVQNLQKHVESESAEEEFEVDESFTPELVGIEALGRPGEEGDDADLDLEAMARDLAAEAGQFQERD